MKKVIIASMLLTLVICASNGIINVIGENPVPSSGIHFEPTSAVGSSTWVHGWFDYNVAQSYASAWQGSWSTKQQVSNQLTDLNIEWAGNMYVYVGGSVSGQISYGYSTDAAGIAWNSPVVALSPGTYSGIFRGTGDLL